MGAKSRLKKERRDSETNTQSHGAKMLAEMKAAMPTDDLAQADLEIIEELIETGREVLRMHRAEAKARIQAMETGGEIPKRWQVSPSVSNSVMRLMEKLINSRRILSGFEPITFPKKPRKKAVADSNKLTAMAV